MKLYIVRHGQTLFNYLERVQGWSDSPLTERGMQQGKAVAEHLSNISFDKVYSSDLNRAIDTAKFILEKQVATSKLTATPLLREAYYGGFEGGNEEGPWEPVLREFGHDESTIKTNFNQANSKVLKEYPNEKIRNIIAENDPLGLAENYTEYSERMLLFIEKLLSDTESDNVLVVCHGGTSQLLLELLLDSPEDITEPDNCSTTIVQIRPDNHELIEYNQISYL